ncbi:hypothetical protein LTS08_006219 [Lithohypha guttulata]|nr:hypothetical protein LTS08_006219 [Lithohypha guttulata]
MVTDLSLDTDPISLMENRHEIFLQYPLLRDDPTKTVEVASLEAQRKPNKLPFTRHTLECAQYLRQRKQYVSDELTWHTVTLQQLAEEVNEMYKFEKISGDLQTLLAHVNDFQGRLDRWKKDIPSNVNNTGLLELRYHAVRVMVYEVGLVHRFGRKRTSPTTTQFQGPSAEADSLMPTFQGCLNAAKDYLDCFLATPNSPQRHLPFEEWTRLTLALFVTYRFSVGIPEVPQWNPEMARTTCDLENYLTRLLGCLESPTRPTTNGIVTMFHIFPGILESVKVAYSLVCEHPLMFQQGIKAHDLGPDAAITSEISTQSHARCPGFQHLARPANDYVAEDDRVFAKEVAADIRAIQERSLQ